jgi:hypothetical protein
MRSVTQKINESEEIISNMFSQFKEIINEMEPTDMSAQVESFKNFITKLGDSIEIHSEDVFKGLSSDSSRDFQVLENSLYNILTDYIGKNQESLEKLWQVNSLEKLREIISISIDKTEKELTIIVPRIEDFIPLAKFDLDYSEIVEPAPTVDKKLSKPTIPSRKKPSISKEQKKEIEDKINNTAKRVRDLKGYELSHDIAEILAKISDINSESLVIENIQGWLNRLLVIRKFLDQNTQYLILEDIEKWKVDYLKIKKEEVNQIEDKSVESEKIELQIDESGRSFKGLKIKIISSEPHENKHVHALNKKHIEYLRLKNNNIVALIGDNSILVFGVSQKTKNENNYEITGLITTFKPFIELIQPSVIKIINSAKPTREIQINKGFNEIIHNINDYSGKKIAKKLNNLFDVAFEKDGLSLNILEFKLLISKLEKFNYPLEDTMKEHVINELNNLNNEFSTLELIYQPEFRPPILEGEAVGEEKKEELIEESQTKLLDPDKINTLFTLFLEKIDELNGAELGEQINKFIDVILNVQGYSKIVRWKRNLSILDKILDDPSKKRLKQDFLRWKKGILGHKPIPEVQTTENTINPSFSQKNNLSGTEEEHISPGLAQTQFPTDNLAPSFANISKETKKIDPKIKIKEEFETIEAKFTELSGVDISKKIQSIVDIILESQGYSMDLKEIKDWVSKLRKIRQPLNDEIIEDFVIAFFKWKEKYSMDDSVNQSLNFGLSIESSENLHENFDVIKAGGLVGKFESLIQDTDNSTGNELSTKLQDISDIVLRSHGAVAANIIRQWISKLRSVRDLLEDELKEQFLVELEKWKEQFT